MSMAVGMQVSKLKKKNQYVRENERKTVVTKSMSVNESICWSVSM